MDWLEVLFKSGMTILMFYGIRREYNRPVTCSGCKKEKLRKDIEHYKNRMNNYQSEIDELNREIALLEMSEDIEEEKSFVKDQSGRQSPSPLSGDLDDDAESVIADIKKD